MNIIELIVTESIMLFTTSTSKSSILVMMLFVKVLVTCWEQKNDPKNSKSDPKKRD